MSREMGAAIATYGCIMSIVSFGLAIFACAMYARRKLK